TATFYTVIARSEATKQSMSPHVGGMDCFASLAMTKREERQIMEIGFIGLGKMGLPMARRLVEAKHQLVVFDARKEATGELVKLGAQAASSPKDVADRTETVMASLPSLQISLEVATGKDGVIEGKKVKRFVDLSTTGSQMAVKIHDLLAKKNIVQVDSPVS